MNNKLVIGLAGMPGAGKSVFISVAKEDGYGVVVMGNIIREEAASKGLEPTPENLGKIMLELRQKEENITKHRGNTLKKKEGKGEEQET